MIRVLLVEDNESFANMLAIFMDKRNSDCTGPKTKLVHKTDIAGALNVLGVPGEFDIVLLDLSLKNGMGVQALIDCFRQAARAPVYVITGDDSHETEEMVLQCGARGHMRKITLIDARQVDDLVREMHQAIRVHEADRKARAEWAKMNAHMESITVKADNLDKPPK